MALAGWVEQAFAFAFFVALARIIGADAFGVAAMALAFVYLGETLVRETLTEGVIAAPREDPDLLDATFRALLIFGGLVSLALLALSPIAAAIYREPQVGPLMAAASLAPLLIASTGVHAALLRRRLAFRALAVRAIVGCVAGGAAGLAVALADGGAWALAAQRLVQVGVNSALALGAARWRPRAGFLKARAAVARGLGGQVVVLRALSLVILQTPIVALGVAAGPRAVAHYAFAWRLVETALYLISTPVKRAAQPTLAALRRSGGGGQTFVFALTEAAAFISFAAFAGLALVAAPLVAAFMDEDWRAAAPLIALLCVAGAALSIMEIQEAYVLAIDRARGLVRAAAAEATIGAALIAGAAGFGVVGVAAAASLRALAGAPLRARAALAAEGAQAARLIAALARPTLLAGLMAVAVAAVMAIAPAQPAPRLAVLALVGIAVWGGAGALLFSGRARRLRAALFDEAPLRETRAAP
jgi:O-antigen/teichoic acid export membrane protein